MGWFDEQIKRRRDDDNEALDESLKHVSKIIQGKTHYAFIDEKDKIKTAIDEILAYYHIKTKEIPDEIKELEDQLEYLCRPHGIMYRHVKFDKGWYKCAAGSFIGRLKSGEIVALTKNKFGFYTFFNPTTQKRVWMNKKSEKLLEEDGYAFYKPFPLKKLTIKDLAKYIVGCINLSTIIYVVILTLCTTLVGMLTPKITRLLYSDIIESKSLQLLLAIAVFYICTSISMLFISSIKSLTMNKINIEMDISVQAATMSRVLSLPASFFKEYNSGEIMSRASYINSLCSTLVSTVLSTGLSSLFSLMYIGQIFEYGPELVLPSVIITVITLLFSLITSFAQMKLTKKRALTGSKMTGLTYQIISGVQKIKLSGSEKRIFSKWLNAYGEEAKLDYNPPKFLLFNGAISSTIFLVGNIVMYSIAIKSGISVADYTAFNASYGYLSGALSSIASIAMTASRIKPIIDMAKPIMDAVPEVSEGKEVVTKINGSIELSNISFKYEENGPTIIDNLSLKIRSGEYIAIVGKTGCGKSTILRLLLGFEKPQKGAVYYDGKDINSLELKSLRRKIGVVNHNGKLFQGDIFSNIIISAPHLTLDDAWKAAEIADIADDIKKMPMGMNTIIAEGSGGISGGQKQRLMIARAVAHSPKILMFDEATSALDNITQKKVSNALDSLKCTRIVIAHRLSTIKQCDRILVMDEGKIIETGNYKDLMTKKGYFYELVKRQSLDENAE